MKTQRDAFFSRLYEIAKTNPDIILIVCDMDAPSLNVWRKDLPDQYINVGPAEQNAITLAAGMTKEGKKVFVYTISSFLVYRAFEQIRLDICYENLPVTLCGVGAGLSYANAGPTHHAIEDIAILRTLPNLRIHNMTDSVMAEAFAEISVGLKYPNYVRFDRGTYKSFLELDNHKFGYKDYKELIGLSDTLIMATGNMVHTAVAVSSKLDCNIMNVFEFPISDEILEGIIVQKYKRIITIEEHVLPGGLGSAVLELLADNNLQIPVKRFGLEGNYTHRVGGREHLQKLYGLDKKSIIKGIKEWM